MQRAVPLSFHRARTLRREETDAERKLWQRLRPNALRELNSVASFRLAISSFDFCCRNRKLVIELDGGRHGEPAGIANDARRTAWLESRGYRVMRFWNNEVLTNIDGVVEMILEALAPESE